jgi:2-methylcitrate dehydratase PrpD
MGETAAPAVDPVQTETLTEAAAYAAELALSRVPDDVVDRAKLVILDTLGVQVAAGADPVVGAIAGALAQQGKGSASAISCPHGLPVAQAAFVNGLAGAWLDYDEVSFEGRQHAAIHVLPAALAVAEHIGASGDTLLTAFIAGYEIGTRVGRASIQRSRLMHSHGMEATIGAAVAAGKLLGQGLDQLIETMRIASGMTVATSWQAGAEGATVRHSYSGQGAQNGVLAALSSNAGLIGEKNGLATVFGRVPGQAFDPAELSKDIGSRYFLATNLFKAYGCGADAHPAVEAVRNALGGKALTPEDVVSVGIWTHAQGARLATAASHNVHVARLSLPYVVARALRGQSLGLEAFAEAARADMATRSLMEKVVVHEDPHATEAHPDEQRARAEIILADGSRLSADFILDPAGRAAWPTPDMLRNKFLTVSMRAIEERHALALMREVDRLAEGGDPRAIGALLRRAGPHTATHSVN